MEALGGGVVCSHVLTTRLESEIKISRVIFYFTFATTATTSSPLPPLLARLTESMHCSLWYLYSAANIMGAGQTVRGATHVVETTRPTCAYNVGMRVR